MDGTSRTYSAVAAMLNPQSIAFVGASERNQNLRHTIEQNEASGASMYLVNPRHGELFGRKTYSSLDSLPAGVDAVLSMVNAELTVDVVEAAARIGARAVVITAAGFGETDEPGRKRQQRIAEIAGANGLAICGPNCNGLINVTAGKNLSGVRIDGIRAGGVALLSQSGGLATAARSAGAERMLGFSYIIATGNEAATDLVDYLEVLIDDADVSAITMIIEEIRRPAAFMQVAYRARNAGKPLFALKLGRSVSGSRIGRSHTGAMMGNARHYDAAFRQVGVNIARDIDDLFDLSQMFSSVPRDRWRTGGRIGVLSASGGSASLASDAFAAEGLPLPVDDELARWVHDLVPTNALGNPFDVTGILYNETAFEPVLRQYADSQAYDSILVVSSVVGPEHDKFCAPISGPLQRLAESSQKRLMLASATASRVGDWTDRLIAAGVGIGRGMAPTARSIKAMDTFVRTSMRPAPPPVATLPRPAGLRTATDGGAELVQFGDAARLAARYGVPIAPFVEIAADDVHPDRALRDLPASPSYVVKVANSLHRTELGLVARHVPREGVLATATRLAERADDRGLSGDVVVQPDLGITSETFLGADLEPAFGPVVAFGIGGIHVEALADISARVAPFTELDAFDLLSEISGRKILDGARGGQAWDVDQLCRILVAFGNLAAAAASWLVSAEINPLVRHSGGVSAVDFSFVIRSQPAAGQS